MKAYTLRLDDETARILKHISIEEGKNIREIILELLNNYMESHRETLEIMSKAGWIHSIKNAERENAQRKLISQKKLKNLINVGS